MAKKVNIRVISGGQVGADKIGLEEARKLGFQTGGTAPLRFQTSKGSDLTLKDYGLTEVSNADTISYQGREKRYGPRTEQNVLKSDITLIYTLEGKHDSPGSKLTRNLAVKHNKPFLQNPTSSQVSELVSGLGKEDVTINIAGNREFTDRKVISQSLQAASSTSKKIPKKLSQIGIKDKKQIVAGKPIKFRMSSLSGIMSLNTGNSRRTISLKEQKQRKIPSRFKPFLNPGGVAHGIQTKNQNKEYVTEPGKNFKQGVYLSGPKDIPTASRVKFLEGVDKVYNEQVKKFGSKNVNIYYGDWQNSSSDSLIRNYAKEHNINLVPISRQHGWKGMSDPDKFKKMTWEQKGDYKERHLAKWEQGDKTLKRYALSNTGKVQYSGADRNYWWNRFNALEKEFGKGSTRKVVQTYLDEVEDTFRGESRQDSSKFEFKKKLTKLPMLDQGETRSTTIKPNISSGLAALELLDEKNEHNTKIAYAKAKREGKPELAKDWLNSVSQERIKNLRGDEGFRLGSDQRIETDYPDSVKEEGTKHVVTDDLGPSKQRKLIDALPYNLRNAKAEWTNKLTKWKDPKIAKIISDTINTREEFGYSGRNVSATENAFGDFAKQQEGKAADQDTTESQPKKNIEFEEKEGVRFVESDQVQNERRTNIAWKQELRGLDRLIRLKNKTDPMTQVEYSKYRKTILEGVNSITDVTSQDLISSINAPFSKEKYNKDGTAKSSGKEIGNNWKPYRPEEEVRASIAEDKRNAKVPPGVQKTTKVVRDKTPTTYSDFPGKAAYLKQRTPQRTLEVLKNTGKVIMKAGGNLSRAYISDPSMGTQRDIRKHVKGIGKKTNIVLSKQKKYTPRSNSSQPNIIKMTKSKVTGKWGTPSEHRKNALKKLSRGASGKLPATLGVFSLFSSVLGVAKAREDAKKYTEKKDPSFSDTMSMMYPHVLGLPRKKHGLNFGDL